MHDFSLKSRDWVYDWMRLRSLSEELLIKKTTATKEKTFIGHWVVLRLFSKKNKSIISAKTTCSSSARIGSRDEARLKVCLACLQMEAKKHKTDTHSSSSS